MAQAVVDTLALGDTTVFGIGELSDHAIYLDFMIKSTPGPEYRLSVHQIGFGVTYHRVIAGVHLTEQQEGYERVVVFPNTFKLKYRYAGVFTGIDFIRKKPVEVSSRLNLSRGDMIWWNEAHTDILSRDTYFVLEPEVQIAYAPIKYLRLYGSVGYRSLLDFDMVSLSPNDFRGFTFGFGLRAGFYK